MSGSINVQNLEIKLVQKMNASTSMQDIFALSAALKQLKSGVVYVVQEFSQLPAVSSALSELWFVVNDRILYTNSAAVGWYPLVTDTVSALWTWGRNYNGELGTENLLPRSSPGTVAGAGSTWCQVSGGYRFLAALKTDGTAWTWGENGSGQLGTGATVARSSPGTLVGGGTTWCQISTSGLSFAGGRGSVVAIKTDGTAWSWGNNNYGLLGDNTMVNRSSPVQVTGTNSNWCQISTSVFHAAAIKQNGALYSWGLNSNGQLGDGTVICRSSPVQVTGTWQQVRAGGVHTVAINSSNAALAWGDNSSGQLGDNTVVARSLPVTVAGACTWSQISAGWRHTGAISTAGCLLTWGRNNYGELGNDTVTLRCSPGNIVGGGTLWCQLSVGRMHTGAITTTGCAWTWGYNGPGYLGDGTRIRRSSPVQVAGGISKWCQISMSTSGGAAIQSKTIG